MKINKLWDEYALKSLEDNKCTPKHIKETKLHVNRWMAYWKDHADKKEATRIPGIKRSHLEEWRRHLVDVKELATRTVNKHLATMRRLLVVAEKHEIIDRRPRLEQLHEIKASTKIFFRDEQIDALFDAAHQLRWPQTSIDAALWWKCAIVLYRTYGFRTQELLAFEKNKMPITWRNISFDPQSPNPDNDDMNEYGWLFYVPPKTQRKKPSPIYLPLTIYTHKALRIMEETRTSDDLPIFNNPRNSERFYGEWDRWMNSAEVKPKADGAKFTPYCLRKTCATHMNKHRAGLATAICRWGKSDEAQIAMDHYISNDMILFEMKDAPMPKSFDTLLAL